MDPLRRTFLASLRSGAGSALVGLLLAAWWGAFSAPTTHGGGAIGVDPGGRLLLVPLGTVLGATLLQTIRRWPGFGRDRDGRAAVARLRVGPVDGCLRAALGTGLALALVLPITALGFDVLRATHRPETVWHRTELELAPASGGLLHRGARSLRVIPGEVLPAGTVVEVLPQLIYSTADALDPARLQLFHAGQPLGEPAEILHTGSPLRTTVTAPLPAGAELELRWLPAEGATALAIRPGSVTARWRSGYPPWTNAALAASSGLLTAAWGLALALLCCRGAVRSVVVLAALGGSLGASLLGLAPLVGCVERYAGNVWSGTPDLQGPVLMSLSAAILCTLGAFRSRT